MHTLNLPILYRMHILYCIVYTHIHCTTCTCTYTVHVHVHECSMALYMYSVHTLVNSLFIISIVQSLLIIQIVLHLINISCSNNMSDNQYLSGWNNSPAMEIGHSIGYTGGGNQKKNVISYQSCGYD